MMNVYEQITKANVLLLIGTDITETNPIDSLRVKEAIRVYGAQVIVATSRLTNIAKPASHPLPIAAASEPGVPQAPGQGAGEEERGGQAPTPPAPGAFAALGDPVARPRRAGPTG